MFQPIFNGTCRSHPMIIHVSCCVSTAAAGSNVRDTRRAYREDRQLTVPMWLFRHRLRLPVLRVLTQGLVATVLLG